MRAPAPNAITGLLFVAAAIVTTSAFAAGSLSISPAILETVAKPGRVGAVTVANTTSAPMRVTVRTRPWRQARSGVVTPDGRRTLSRQVRVSPASFTLPAGQRRAIDVRLLRAPAGGSLYGSVEIIGTPPAAKRGIRTRSRLIAGLRLNPLAAQRVLRVQVGRIRAGGRSALMAVRNAGNTVTPLTGSVRISGGSGTLRTTIAEARILPGATVDLSLRSGRLLAGRYTATVTLRQAGRRVASVKRRFTVR